MLYPLYEYYLESELSLEQIITHYTQRFYLQTHGRNRSQEIEQRVKDSSKLKSLDPESIKQRVVPNYMDFGGCINEMLWFIFKSNSTQALAVLIAAREWGKRVNDKYHFGTSRELRDKAIRIFLKYDMHEEMTYEEFSSRAKL